MASEEASAGRQWRGMYRFENKVLERVDHGLFGDGIVAPQNEDEMFPLFGEGANGRIGELLPAMAGV